MSKQEIEYQHSKGIIGAIVFHVILILALLYFGFITPLPLPGEEGILVNFGTDATGFGEEEPFGGNQTTELAEAKVSPTSTPEVAEEENMTQDFEEAPVVKPKKEIKKETTKVVETPKEEITPVKEEVKATPTEEVKEVKKEERQVDAKSLFPGKSKIEGTGTSQGIAGGTGNQGDPSGNSNSNNYSGKAGGGGGGGEGISYSLAGRVPQSLPKPEFDNNKSGTVVVEILVDNEGRVTSATAGVKGSTTLDAYLLKVAKDAAMKARFDRKPEAAAIQKGTITYQFKLN